MSQRDDDLKLIDNLAAATGLSRAEAIAVAGEVAQVMLLIVASKALRGINPTSVAVALGVMSEITIASIADETKVDRTRLREQCLAAIDILRANADKTWINYTKSQN